MLHQTINRNILFRLAPYEEQTIHAGGNRVSCLEASDDFELALSESSQYEPWRKSLSIKLDPGDSTNQIRIKNPTGNVLTGQLSIGTGDLLLIEQLQTISVNFQNALTYDRATDSTLSVNAQNTLIGQYARGSSPPGYSGEFSRRKQITVQNLSAYNALEICLYPYLASIVYQLAPQTSWTMETCNDIIVNNPATSTDAVRFLAHEVFYVYE